MEDNIIFSKVWEDDCLIELRVTCTSSAASVISNIYVSDDSINELICKIRQFLCSKDNDETSSWTSIGSEDGSVACVSLRFFKERYARAYRRRSVCGYRRRGEPCRTSQLLFCQYRVRFVNELL